MSPGRVWESGPFPVFPVGAGYSRGFPTVPLSTTPVFLGIGPSTLGPGRAESGVLDAFDSVTEWERPGTRLYRNVPRKECRGRRLTYRRIGLPSDRRPGRSSSGAPDPGASGLKRHSHTSGALRRRRSSRGCSSRTFSTPSSRTSCRYTPSPACFPSSGRSRW